MLIVRKVNHTDSPVKHTAVHLQMFRANLDQMTESLIYAVLMIYVPL